MDCPAGNQAYIFYNRNHDFAPSSPNKAQDGTTHLHYYNVQTSAKITCLRLLVIAQQEKISKVTLYKGTGSSAIEIASVPDTTGDSNIFLTFEPISLRTEDSEVFTLGLVPEGEHLPMFYVELYESVITFPDGFFDKIEPSRTDRGGGVIELADGTLVQYKGYGGNRWRWKLGAKFVDKETLDRLDALYAERPEFLFAQEPDRYPKRIHRCILESPIFRIPYTTQWKGNGYSIEMEIAQV